MRLFASPIGIWSAVLVGIAATAIFGQSFVVFHRHGSIWRLAQRCAGGAAQNYPGGHAAAYATASAYNGPSVVAGTPGAWPKAPPGFVVELVVSGLDNPRLIR